MKKGQYQDLQDFRMGRMKKNPDNPFILKILIQTRGGEFSPTPKAT